MEALDRKTDDHDNADLCGNTSAGRHNKNTSNHHYQLEAMPKTHTRTCTMHPTIIPICHQVLVIPHTPHPCLSKVLLVTHPHLLVATPNMGNMGSHPTLAVPQMRAPTTQLERRLLQRQPRSHTTTTPPAIPSTPRSTSTAPTRTTHNDKT